MHVPSTQCEAIVHCLLRDSIDSLHFRFHLTCFHLFTSLFWSSRSSADLTKLRFVAKPAASTWNALTYICHLPYAICARVMDFEERAHLRTPQWIGMMWCVCLSSSVISYFEVNAYRSIKPECVSIQSTGTITTISATPPLSLSSVYPPLKRVLNSNQLREFFKNDLHMKLIIFVFIYLFIGVLTFKSHVKSKIQSEYRARN